jgi:hypothetical protein
VEVHYGVDSVFSPDFREKPPHASEALVSSEIHPDNGEVGRGVDEQAGRMLARQIHEPGAGAASAGVVERGNRHGDVAEGREPHHQGSAAGVFIDHPDSLSI